MSGLRVEDVKEALCLGCEARSLRVLPDPIPEGHPVMFTEMMAGRGLYCDECFDNQTPPESPEVPTPEGDG